MPNERPPESQKESLRKQAALTDEQKLQNRALAQLNLAMTTILGELDRAVEAGELELGRATRRATKAGEALTLAIAAIGKDLKLAATFADTPEAAENRLRKGK